MNRVEDLGFSVMASYEAKLTMVEGVMLGAGAALAIAAAHLASKSLAEQSRGLADATPEQIEKLSSDLLKDQEFMATLREKDRNLRNLQNWPQDEVEFLERGHVSSLAKFAIETGTSPSEIRKLLERGAADLIVNRLGHDSPLLDLTPSQRLAVAKLSRLPEAYSTAILTTIAEEARFQNDLFPREEETDVPLEERVHFLQDLEYLADVDSGIVESALEHMRDDRNYKDGEVLLVGLLRGYVQHHKNRSILEKHFTMDQRRVIHALEERGLDMSNPIVLSALQEIASKRTQETVHQFAPHLGSADDLIEFARLEGDLPSTSDLSIPFLKSSSSIDWKLYKKNVEDYQRIPFELFDKTGVNKQSYLDLFRAANKSDDFKKAIFLTVAIRETIPSTKLASIMALTLSSVASLMGNPWPEEQGYASSSLETFDRLSKAFKSGMLKKFDDTFKSKWGFIYQEKLSVFLMNLDAISDWKTSGELTEQLQVLAGTTGESSRATRYGKETKIQRRARDRLARRDPEWAISQFPDEYRRGKRIAKFLEQLVDHVESLVKKGETVVVHGRDGELLYDLLMRRPGIDRSKVKYAITSRPVTTWSVSMPVDEPHSRELRRYWDYLQRLVPLGAVHIDTGFEGSIPRWLDKQGFEVKAIKMVSANRPEEEIPVNLPISSEERRDIVLSDLEHSSQRIETLEKYDPIGQARGFGDLIYSYNAPGYHARAYGVYDELGLPRLKTKTPKTRFEEQRLRIAAELSEEDEASLEDEGVLAVK